MTRTYRRTRPPVNFESVWFWITALTSITLATLASAPTSAANAQQPERFTSWTHPVFPVAEYRARLDAAHQQLGENDVFLVPSAEGTSGGETFRQLDDFQYFTGLEVSRSVLAIDGRTKLTLLFVPDNDPRFENAGRPNDFPGRPLVGDPALGALTGVDSVLSDTVLVRYLGSLQAEGATVLVNSGSAPRSAGNEVRDAPIVALSEIFRVVTPGEQLLRVIQQRQPSIKTGNAFDLIARLRMIKSEREIGKLRESARITAEAIVRGAARVKSGVDERTLTGSFISDCMGLGAQRVAFTPIIKSGMNSLWPWRILGAHYDRRNRVLGNGELMIYDVGCERDYYVSDVGRTFPVSEHFTARQRELIEMVKMISDAVIAAAKPGVTFTELQRVAADRIPESAKPFMQAPLYFGHHIGLDTGDPAIASAKLTAGMVFTIEPWYYNHIDEVAVFIEDEILITATGSENLTRALPRDADGLELLRNGNAATDRSIKKFVTRDAELFFAVHKRRD